MKLLVVMPSKYVGNMTIAMQALAATLAHHARDEVTLLVDENFQDLIELCFGSQCAVLIYPRRAIGTSSVVSRIGRFMRFIATLRSRAWDLAVDFDGTVVSARLMRLARAKDKVGPGFAKRPGVYDRLIPIDRDVQHCFDDYRIMAEAVGVQLDSDRYLPIPPVPDAVAYAGTAAETLRNLAGKRFVCIHPCATKDYKQWDIHRFAALADRLTEAGWTVVLIGAGEGERERVDNMIRYMACKPLNLHGKLSLLQLTWLFQHAGLFIGNDSGPMHLASACGTHVIALFGPTELLRWEPRGPSVRIVKGLQPCDPACRPEACLQGYRCLGSLTVDQVIEADGTTDR